MSTPTREQVIGWAKEAGIDANADTLCRHEGWLEPITQLCTLAMSAGRDQGLREASYPAGFEPVEFLVGVEMWVKAAYQKGGDRLWKITRGFGEVLNKQGQWESEPSPSNRTDDFLARCRYATLEECSAAIEQLRGKP